MWSSLLERAHRGHVTVITRYGKPYAAIAPVSADVKEPTGMRIQDLRGSGKGLWQENATAWVHRTRDEWA